VVGVKVGLVLQEALRGLLRVLKVVGRAKVRVEMVLPS
jgi:hypothetical protein